MKILFCSLLIGIMAGGFPGILWSGFCKHKLSKFLCTSLMILVFTLFAYGGISSELTSFNNGYCIRCGTKYQALTHRDSQTYYECPNCHYGVWH